MKILVRPSRSTERWPGHPEELWFAWAEGEAAGCLGDTPERTVNKVLASLAKQPEQYTVEIIFVVPDSLKGALRPMI
jgi:hypothetical protein